MNSFLTPIYLTSYSLHLGWTRKDEFSSALYLLYAWMGFHLIFICAAIRRRYKSKGGHRKVSDLVSGEGDVVNRKASLKMMISTNENSTQDVQNSAKMCGLKKMLSTVDVHSSLSIDRMTSLGNKSSGMSAANLGSNYQVKGSNLPRVSEGREGRGSTWIS